MANFTIETTSETSTNGKYLLLVEGRPFYIGALVRSLLLSRSEGKEHPAIARELTAQTQGHHNFEAAEVSQMLQKYRSELGVDFDASAEAQGAAASNEMRTGIFGQFTLLKEGQIDLITRSLQYLFTPYIFVPILVIALILNVIYMRELIELYASLQALQAAGIQADAESTVSAVAQCGRNWQYAVLFYPAAFGVMLFHELGHAAASRRFGVKTNSIGAGFYLLFPVMFADITKAWKVSRGRRLIINAAGIFVQLLVNLILIFLVYRTSDMVYIQALRYLMILNIATMVLNLNFIFKFDGYWIYSDLFKLPNLSRNSYVLMAVWMEAITGRERYKIPQRIRASLPHRNPWLILFTALRIVFYALIVYYLILHLIPRAATNLVTSGQYLLAGGLSVCQWEFIGKTAMLSGVAGYLSYRYGKKAINLVKR